MALHIVFFRSLELYLLRQPMAIAFDSSSEGNEASVTSLTFAHTCTGARRMLFVFVLGYLGDLITGVTYNGVAMTQVAKKNTWVFWLYLFCLKAPALGTNNIVVTRSDSNRIEAVGLSYTGVEQTNVVDSSATQTTASTTSITQTTTSVADNCWAVCGTILQPTTAWAGSTLRRFATSWVTGFDTDWATTPAGTISMTQTWASPANEAWIIASFAPYIPLPPNSNFFSIL